MNYKFILYPWIPLLISILFVLFLRNIPLLMYLVPMMTLGLWCYIGTLFWHATENPLFALLVGNLFLWIDGILFIILKPWLGHVSPIFSHLTMISSSILSPFLHIFSPLLGNHILENGLIGEYISIFVFLICFMCGFLYKKRNASKGRYTFNKALFK